MTTRERHLAAAVGTILGVAGIAFLAYSFVLSPYLDKVKQIKTRSNEVTQLELDILDIQARKKKFENARRQSLPADVGVSRLHYNDLLVGLIRRSNFAPGSYKITVGEADSKSAPTLAAKKPIYTKLSYDLALKGELYNLVDFLQLFYRQPLLHTIKSINIQRPSDSKAQQARQLDAVLKIEALVLDNSERRPTLLPVSRELALMSGAAAQVGFNLNEASGRGADATDWRACR